MAVQCEVSRDALDSRLTSVGGGGLTLTPVSGEDVVPPSDEDVAVPEAEPDASPVAMDIEGLDELRTSQRRVSSAAKLWWRGILVLSSGTVSRRFFWFCLPFAAFLSCLS